MKLQIKSTCANAAHYWSRSSPMMKLIWSLTGLDESNLSRRSCQHTNSLWLGWNFMGPKWQIFLFLITQNTWTALEFSGLGETSSKKWSFWLSFCAHSQNVPKWRSDYKREEFRLWPVSSPESWSTQMRCCAFRGLSKWTILASRQQQSQQSVWKYCKIFHPNSNQAPFRG